jgi:hypothetical protein
MLWYSQMFLIPVYKGESSMMFLLSQCQDQHIITTYLEGMSMYSCGVHYLTFDIFRLYLTRIEYKKNPSAAQAWLSVALYTELLDEKDMVLMRSDYLPNLTRKVSEVCS